MSSSPSKLVVTFALALSLPLAGGAFANLCLGCVALWQDAPGFNLVGTLSSGDGFGAAVAVGDWNGDGFDDVALSDAEIAGTGGGGAVHVLYSNLLGVSSDDDFFSDFDPISGLPDEEPGDAFGSALVAGDFDGDGFDDLAIGIYLEDATVGAGTYSNCGAVLVLYGAPTGLTQAGAQKLFSTAAGDLTSAHFGFSLAAGDFDGDGFDELVAGSPAGDVGALDQAGYISIHDGSAAGLSPSAQIVHQDSNNGSGSVSDAAEALDRFGWALVVGNFNGDTNGPGGPPVMDLAVGAMGEGDATAGTSGSGLVHVFYGDPFFGGLPFNTDQSIHQANTATGQTLETGDAFGFTLAAGDVNGDGMDEIVVGAPHEDVVSGAVNVIHAGLVTVIRGGFPFIVASAGAVSLSQDDFAIGESPETDDFFGWAIAVGDVDGDGLAEIFIGAPFEDVVDPVTFSTFVDAGAVTVVPGWPSTFPSATAPPRFVAQRHGGHRGTLDPGDLYATALAVGEFDDDGHADLAVGAPGEDAVDGAVTYFGAGALYVARGSRYSDGFESGNATYWSDEFP